MTAAEKSLNLAGDAVDCSSLFKCSCHAKVASRKPHSKISIAPATSSYRHGRQLCQPAALIGQRWRQQPMGSQLSFGGRCPYLRLAGPVFGPLQFRHRRDHSSVSDHIHTSPSTTMAKVPYKVGEWPLDYYSISV